ncbi:hypothetical protein [Chamaesiphon polymorphus]|uniref:hypothetical protein n=1 Tax=Chamaesiphon polymorphus TaxID=2107691 RepID=UPI0015E747F5|nr:hypothetical protein [Chamaesiphon polymorphus]
MWIVRLGIAHASRTATSRVQFQGNTHIFPGGEAFEEVMRLEDIADVAAGGDYLGLLGSKQFSIEDFEAICWYRS